MESQLAGVGRLSPLATGVRIHQRRLVKNVGMNEDNSSHFVKGFSRVERSGRWSDGQAAQIIVPIEDIHEPFIDFTFEIAAFLAKDIVQEQRVTVRFEGEILAEWVFREGAFRMRQIELDFVERSRPSEVVFDLELHDAFQPKSLGLGNDQGYLAILLRRLKVFGSFERVSPDPFLRQYGRFVGEESRKSFDRRVESGFWQKYVTGPNILDIGFRGGAGSAHVVPILEGAIGVDLDYPGYNGVRLPFKDQSQDVIYSSHCLEHIANYVEVIQDWFRVTRVGGHIIVNVPSLHMYERRRQPPSQWNRDHKRFYTPAALLREFESALKPNTYRVRFLEENDVGYRYDLEPDRHPAGEYEITLVIERIVPPGWSID